jgi:predicted nucleic acid-binding protein
MSDFLDSNVILYVFVTGSEFKRRIAEKLVEDSIEADAVISFQVVQEVLNRLSRQDQSSRTDAERVLSNVLLPLWKVMPSEQLYRRALATHTRYRFSFYDSLIIAAALEAGCDRLYSEDLQHGQRIEGLTIHNPFLDA